MKRQLILTSLVLLFASALVFASFYDELAEQIVEELLADQRRPGAYVRPPLIASNHISADQAPRRKFSSSTRGSTPKKTPVKKTTSTTRSTRTNPVKTRIATRKPSNSGKRPSGQTRPRTQKPKTSRPKLRTQKPIIKQRTQKPRSSKPKSRKPSTRKPTSQKPKSRKPTSAKPKSTKPKTQKPSTKKPKSEKPRTRKPQQGYSGSSGEQPSQQPEYNGNGNNGNSGSSEPYSRGYSDPNTGSGSQDPSSPSGPVGPSEPSGPVEPSGPSGPVEPSGPSGPIGPSNPSEGGNPGGVNVNVSPNINWTVNTNIKNKNIHNYNTKHHGHKKNSTTDAELKEKGDAAAQFAIQQVGKCYSSDENMRKGPDCFDASGLVTVAWENQGISSLPDTIDGYEKSKKIVQVEIDQIREGDVVFKENHVALFVGNGTVVEAKSEQGVVQTNLEEFNHTAVYRPK